MRFNRVKIRLDQKVFASAGWDGRVRIFSWKSLRPLAVLTEHKRNVLDLIYSPGTVQLWSPATACPAACALCAEMRCPAHTLRALDLCQRSF